MPEKLDSEKEFVLPESVMAYLHDPVVHGAVESVFNHASNDLPGNLKLEEVELYYRARASALAVKYDMIIAIHDLWSRVWAEAVKGWKPGDLSDREIDPDYVWDNKSFDVFHTYRADSSKSFRFYTGVEIIESDRSNGSSIQIYCSLTPDDGIEEELLEDQDIEGLVFNSDKKLGWENWTKLTTPIPIPESGKIPTNAWLPVVSRVRATVECLITESA